jgi:hypothetical protein
MALTKATNRMIEGAAVHVRDFGAVGDALLSDGSANPSPTDDTAAFAAALAASNSIVLGTGNYYISNLTVESCTIKGNGIGGGSNIMGDGDLFVGVHNLSMNGVRFTNLGFVEGKHISFVTGSSGRLGSFTDCNFAAATYHIYTPDDIVKAVVGIELINCNFADASVISRYYQCGLINSTEFHCYTWYNKRGFVSTKGSENCSFLDSVFEYNDEEAIHIEPAAANGAYGYEIANTRFEVNGNVTPGPDVVLKLTSGTGMKLAFRNNRFSGSTASPNVSKTVTGSSTAQLRFENNQALTIDAADRYTWFHEDEESSWKINAAKGHAISGVFDVCANASSVKFLTLFDKSSAESTLNDRSVGAHVTTLRNGAGTAINANTLAPRIDGWAKSLRFQYNQTTWDAPDSTDFSFGDGTNDTPMSIVWMGKLHSTVTNIIPVGKTDGTTGTGANEYQLYFEQSTGKLHFYCWDDSASAHIGRTAPSGSITPSSISEALYHTIVVTKSSGVTAAAIKIYVDGIRVDDTSVGAGTYVAMENSATKLSAHNRTAAGAIVTYGGHRTAVVSLLGEELNASQVVQMDALLRGYAGDALD